MKTPLGLTSVLVIAAPALGSVAAQPTLIDTVTLTSTADNTIYSIGGNARSNGAGPTMAAGIAADGGITRALVRFDATGAIPTHATINSVSLVLHIDGTAASSSPSSFISVRRLLNSWGEGLSTPIVGPGNGGVATKGDATWFHRFFPSQSWSVHGGDFAWPWSSHLDVGSAGSAIFTGAGLVADVQAWVNLDTPEFGWLLLGDEQGAASARFLSTRESVHPPQLVVDYTYPTLPLGTNYCDTGLNSSGFRATLTGRGSPRVIDNNLTITAHLLPLLQFGLILTSQTQATPGSINLCLGGQIGRFAAPSQILDSGVGGTFSLSLDLNAFPQGSGLVAVTAGQTWNFQAWFRDTAAPGSNFTDGLEIQFR